MTDQYQRGQELDVLAQEVDDAIAAQDTLQLKSLIATCEQLHATASDRDRVTLLYFASNAHDALRRHDSSDAGTLWKWDQPDAVASILCLRRAMIERGYAGIHPILRAQIATNLANQLDYLGRQVEAVEHWDIALQAIPNFAMAHGNRAIGLIHLARGLYDEKQAALLLESAEQSLKRALEKDAVWESGNHPEARTSFELNLARVSERLGPIRDELKFDRKALSLGEAPDEVAYRCWCLEERLFLNPLNDIMTDPFAAQDVLHLPSHSYLIEETPRFPNYYNILKQEYVSARFRLFNAREWDKDHIADRDVLLLDGADGGVFGHRVNELMMAFRAAYSLFDKIAVFLNDYFKVGLSPNHLHFRQVFERQVKGGGWQVHPVFQGSQNLRLRGLYFLGKDLFDDDFKAVAAPEAQELASIRNQLEHRFLSLQYFPASQNSTEEHAYISVDDFQDKTLRLLRLARAALTYLSLTMRDEEERRAMETDRNTVSVPIFALPIGRGRH